MAHPLVLCRRLFRSLNACKCKLSGMPPPAIKLPQRSSAANSASLHRQPRTDDNITHNAADEQTQLINNNTRRTLYTPPPASPTLSPASRSHSSLSFSSQSPHLSDLEDSTMDSTPLASDDRGAGYNKHLIIADDSQSTASSSSPLHSSSSLSSTVRRRRPFLITIVIAAITLVSLVSYLAYHYLNQPKPPPFTKYTTCDVFCTGPILAAYQMAALFNDSKTFVDFPLLHSPSTVYQSFLSLSNLSTPTLRTFLHNNFNTSATDLLPWSPPDWLPSPPRLTTIRDPYFRNFSHHLNRLWFLLGRQIHPDVYEHPERHTLLPLRHDKMVVPGGRFREFYYWDSYWIVRGLLLCNMTSTARMVVENLIGMVEAYGFVPNGSRQYYLTRSQPPFLALMVEFVGGWDGGAGGGMEWQAEQLSTLEKEYVYWMTEGEHMVVVADKHNGTHQLNRYYASVQYPRPESYLEDVLTARSLATHNHSVTHQQRQHAACSADSPDCDLSDTWSDQAKSLFSELSASAETGWDFSSRWFADRRNISTAETSHIIPVDLNAVMYGVERVLSKMFNATGDQSKGAAYAAAADRRLDGMHAVLFENASVGGEDGSHYVWRDYDFHERRLDGEVNVLSNFIPLWTHAYDERVNVSRVIDWLLDTGLVQPGGLLTSLDDIGQQWDCPNAWPPLQHMIMEGIATSHYQPTNTTLRTTLANLLTTLPAIPPTPYTPIPLPPSSTPTPSATALAYYLSTSWLYGNAQLYNSTGVMYEKYYALTRGLAGHGGEYEVQQGFGWTNGVALIMLEQYGEVLDWEQVGAMQSPLQMNGAACTFHP